MRMTTLHEEPLGGHRSLDEEPEDSYSDSEYAAEYEQERQQNKSLATRSRLTASKTMDSFMDVSSHSSQSYLSYTSSANANMKHLTGLTTLSMSSSTSSGYGSQAVSCNNLSNEDITSMRSMSIDETPGECCTFCISIIYLLKILKNWLKEFIQKAYLNNSRFVSNSVLKLFVKNIKNLKLSWKDHTLTLIRSLIHHKTRKRKYSRQTFTIYTYCL